MHPHTKVCLTCISTYNSISALYFHIPKQLCLIHPQNKVSLPHTSSFQSNFASYISTFTPTQCDMSILSTNISTILMPHTSTYQSISTSYQNISYIHTQHIVSVSCTLIPQCISPWHSPVTESKPVIL